MKKLLLTVASLALLTAPTWAQYPQYPYPAYPNPAYVARQRVDVRGTVQAIQGVYLTVAAPQGVFTFMLDRHVNYNQLRYLRLGQWVHVDGHIRPNGQLMADHVHRVRH